MDITCIPQDAGLHLSYRRRRLVQWASSLMRLSMTLEAGICVNDCLKSWPNKPNGNLQDTDQGSQFTSLAFIGTLIRKNIVISTDDKLFWPENVSVVSLWQTVKYEEAHPKARQGQR